MLRHIALVSSRARHNRPDCKFAIVQGMQHGEPRGIRKNPEPRGNEFKGCRRERGGDVWSLDWHCYMAR